MSKTCIIYSNRLDSVTFDFNYAQIKTGMALNPEEKYAFLGGML